MWGCSSATSLKVVRMEGLLTQCHTLHLGSLWVGQVPVHLINNLLLDLRQTHTHTHTRSQAVGTAGVRRERRQENTHLSDGVTVEHLDRCHVGALAVHQHLQSLATEVRGQRLRWPDSFRHQCFVFSYSDDEIWRPASSYDRLQFIPLTTRWQYWAECKIPF